jgi:hypothetical protein
MINKQSVHSYEGMQKDISNSKYQPNFYFEGHNIRINSTDSQSTSSVTNEKGNALILTIPKPVINKSNPNLKKIIYTNVETNVTKELIYKTTEIDNLSSIKDQLIIGHSNSRNHVIIFTTNNEGFDCIWKLTYDSYDLTLLYTRNMGFSTNNPIQTINNFENKNVDKVYWVNSKSQMRFINIYHSITNQDIEELIDVSIDVIDMVGKYNLNQPIISNITSGGTHTSGMIQYAYNLYKLNSSQTKISPLTDLISLDKGNQGGNLNEIVSTLPVINIYDIDSNYTNIRVYAVKYTSYNEIPSVSLIADKSIPSDKSIQIFDDGSIISTLSLEEFIFLGSDIIIPKHINSKDNRLFFANYQEINFDVDLDTRACSFPVNSTSTTVYKDLDINYDGNPTGTSLTVYSDYDIPKNHDTINLDYNNNRYQYNNSVQGGEGKYLKYELTQSIFNNKRNRYFKDDEIYRLGIIFYNKYGQKSLPKWIADFKAPSGNLDGKYNTLKVTLKSEFFTWLNTNNFLTEYDKPVGYKTLIAERTVNDKTIVASGLLSTMMLNNKSSSSFKPDNLVKLPNILIRNYNDRDNGPDYQSISRPLFTLADSAPMSRIGSSHSGGPRGSRPINHWDTETPKDIYFGRSFQFNRMVQMYSPEIIFNDFIVLSESLQFKIKGGLLNNENNAWSRVFLGDKKIHEGRNYGSLTPYHLSTEREELQKDDSDGSWDQAFTGGFICGDIAGNGDKNSKIMFDRHYETNYIPCTNSEKFDIYGKPELVEKGQSAKNYNNDSKFRYANSLEGFATDGNTGFRENNDGPFNKRIINVNTFGNKNITFVPQILVSNIGVPQALEDTVPNINNFDNTKEYGLIGELIKSDTDIYFGKIYGGNSYEDKKRTNYIEIGSYSKLNSLFPSINIDSPGDTFVGIFKFLRMLKTDKDITSTGTGEIGEIVSVLCETTVDLKNRSDTSFNDWKSKFQPSDDEYHKYNKVYSQTSNLIQNKDINYNVKKVNNFDTNIISSKLKSSGELIDSWTDILQNEVLTLDGKYGSINNLVNFNDQIFTLQNRAFAQISINPRVQVQGDDGISVELGSGGVLQEYKYATTESGTINKWSVIPTSKGIYYYDLLNKSFMLYNGQVNNLSDTKGLHSFFNKNAELLDLKLDNPLIKKGLSTGYDQINSDIFMTFHKDNQPFTISYNELRNQFISFYDYKPSMYISNGQYFITTSPDLKSIYRQYAGEYNKFYGEYKPSYVILNVNPEANLDTVFDNIMYKSEVYLNDIDQPDKTLTKVRLYSEYQDSGLIPLTLGRNSNLRRKFRDWNAILPRNQGSRERIRNPWVKLVLQFDNTSNYKLILHDVVISYSV